MVLPITESGVGKMFSLPTPMPTFNRAPINIKTSNHEDRNILTVPELIEYNAIHNPNHPFCVQVRKQSQSGSLDFFTISHLQLKQAILQCQEWLRTTVAELSSPVIGEDGTITKGSPVALFVESDIGFLIYKLSLIGLGVPVLLLSARLSPVAIQHLLAKTATKAIVVSPRLKNTVKESLSLSLAEQTCALYAQVHWESFLVPQGAKNLAGGTIYVPGYYIDERDRHVVIFHSSGSTGLPKPLYQSHEYLIFSATCHSLSANEEIQGLNLSTTPLYHAFGLMAASVSLAVGKPVCLPPPSVIPTGAYVVELLRATGAHSLMVAPSILEEICLLPESKGITALAPLQFVAYGGARLKSIVGEKLASASVGLVNVYGTTETGPLTPIFVPGADYDWRYFRLRRDIDWHLRPDPLAEDGVQSFTLVTSPPGWGSTFEIQDQLIANPRNPTSEFNAVGRKDDLIVLATGEKVLPHILEASLLESELVSAAIAFGEGQFELGVIVQPSLPLTVEQFDQFKSSIWPIILEAGNRMDNHARISSEDAIIIVPPGDVLPRSDKRSIIRKEVYKVLAADIARVYQDLENKVPGKCVQALTMDNLEGDLKCLIQTRMRWKIPAEHWTADDDLFELGMDSLQAVQLRRFILFSLPESTGSSPLATRIGRDFIYQHRSVANLANAIRASVETRDLPPCQNGSIDEFISRYSSGQKEAGAVIMLTGSTGSLGTHLLAHLADLPSVARVICLNRFKSDASSETDPFVRQLESAEAKRVIVTREAWSKIEVVQSNMALPFLGLTETKYADMCKQVTHIVHNAWPMNFNLKLSSFESQFQILLNILNFGTHIHTARPLIRPRILFVSSIAVVGHYPVVREEMLVPEIAMNDEKCTSGLGYAKAKLVCEKILENAAHDCAEEMEVAYVRVGQMSGSTKSGFWNTSEYMAQLIKSSKGVGSLPRLNGTFSWLPVDYAAATLSELLLNRHPFNLVYHLENPIRQSWNDTLSMLASKLNLADAELTPFDNWLDAVSAMTNDSTDNNPATELIEFLMTDFKRLACGDVILDTARMRDASPTLRRVTAVSHEVIASYVDYWKSIGFLNDHK